MKCKNFEFSMTHTHKNRYMVRLAFTGVDIVVEIPGSDIRELHGLVSGFLDGRKIRREAVFLLPPGIENEAHLQPIYHSDGSFKELKLSIVVYHPIMDECEDYTGEYYHVMSPYVILTKKEVTELLERIRSTISSEAEEAT